MENAVAFIHARGGSKRIPRKNVKDFHGKPAIAYPIEAALNSNVFSKVIVSTDDKEIADIARQFGAEVPYMRPPHLADDTTPTDPVFVHDIKTLRETMAFDYACCIYGTSIFLEGQYLEQGYNLLKEEKLHSVVSMTEFDFPIQRAFLQKEDETIYLREPEFRLMRSQDLPEAYHDAALFYFVDVQKYLSDVRLFKENETKGIKIPHYKIVDIDTPDDWIRAEMYYDAIQKTKS